jgi:hypothetical protein
MANKKTTTKLLGIAAVALAIVFSFAGCDNPTSNDSNSNNNSETNSNSDNGSGGGMSNMPNKITITGMGGLTGSAIVSVIIEPAPQPQIVAIASAAVSSGTLSTTLIDHLLYIEWRGRGDYYILVALNNTTTTKIYAGDGNAPAPVTFSDNAPEVTLAWGKFKDYPVATVKTQRYLVPLSSSDASRNRRGKVHEAKFRQYVDEELTKKQLHATCQLPKNDNNYLCIHDFMMYMWSYATVT